MPPCPALADYVAACLSVWCQVVWSVLLLVEMVLSYLNLAANFPVLCVDVVQRVVDLFRVRTNTHPPPEGQCRAGACGMWRRCRGYLLTPMVLGLVSSSTRGRRSWSWVLAPSTRPPGCAASPPSI